MATPATPDDVSRLYARAAFGATKNNLTTFSGQDYDTVVAALFPPASLVPDAPDAPTLPPSPDPAVKYPATPEAPVAPSLPPAPDDVRRVQLEAATTDIKAIQRWWLQRMASASFPLVERMTLFWHSLLATSFAQPPDAGNLMVQNELFRRNALGDFRQLMYEATIDPAMLYWLSGNNNRRNAVNENYARELFELFTMGTRPQTYTEDDIRQAAKALTGWYLRTNRVAEFDPGRHDTSEKVIFGEKVGGYRPTGGPLEKEEYKRVVDLALKQPTTAKFIAYKLVSSFAYKPATNNLLTDPDPLVDAVAANLRPALPDGKWDIAAAMHTLLEHQDFRYPDQAAGERVVRSPIEVTVHLAKAMGVNCDPVGGWSNTNANVNQPITALKRMGQVPFEPPNVFGWPSGTDWLTTITTRSRYDLVFQMIAAYNRQNQAALYPMPASTDIPGWVAYLGLGSLSPVTQSRLNSYLANPGTNTELTKQQSILYLLVSSPDWQVI